MLTILMGRAGSGKSAAVLSQLNQHRYERGQILLVPEHTSHEAEMDLLKCCGDTASANAEVLSFASLARRVLSETGGGADFTLDGGGKLLTMRRSLQDAQHNLRVFGKPSRRAAFLQQLTDLMDEFYAYDIAPETLHERIKDVEGAMGDKLRDLAYIFTAYDARLRSGGIDSRSRMEKLCDHLHESRYFDGKDLYVDGFSFFTKQEERILGHALRRCHSVTVTLLGEQYNHEFFQNAAAQRERLKRLADDAGAAVRFAYLKNDSKSALAHLERHIFGFDRAYEGEDAAEHIALYEAADAYAEVEYVSAEIRRLVTEEGYRYRDIAVACRDMERYGALLEMVLRRDGISAYMSLRRDLTEKAVITMLLYAVDAVTGGFEYEDMFRCLKTGLAGISRDECDLLENYVVRWDIHGRMWIREQLWTAHPEGYGLEFNDRSHARLEEINRIREVLRPRFAALYKGLAGESEGVDKARALYDFAIACGVPQQLREKADAFIAMGEVQQAEEYVQLWSIFCGVLDQFVEILGSEKMDGEEFARLLRLVLSRYSVGTIPATLDQVKISEITRNDRHRVRAVFLLGANDSVLPRIEPQGGILDEEARRLMSERELPLSDATFDALDNELQNIYACLAQPTDYLHISWCCSDSAGTELRPSFVVERMGRLFPQLRVRREDGEYRLRLESAALCLAAEDERLWRYFRDSGRCNGVLDAMERARTMPKGKLSPAAVEGLYGKKLAMSASRMDNANSCHFSYFMRYGLRAKERKSASFEAPEIGTFVHYLLENVSRDVKELGGWAKVEQKELRGMVRTYVERYAAEEIDRYEEKSPRFRYLFHRLRETAYDIIDSIAEELRTSDFVPVAFELGFGGRDGVLQPITVTEGGAQLSLSGKVDRVDGWVKDDKLYLRVVDYKTGKKAFDLTDVRYGLGLQMLLYLFTLGEKGSAYFGKEIVPAGVLYHPARSEILRMERNTGDEKIADALRKSVARTGLVLGEPEVLQAMEHSALEKPTFLPISVNKDGNISGGIASAAQLGKLGRYVDKLLHDITREIADGNIDADPYARGPQEGACTYCPFASACYFDKQRDTMRYLKKTSPDEFWQIVDQETGEVESNG
ncbi:MAG: PD-(D/E)XK nuclease family protein [Oscillospiraceae bacterium]|nr:PD-(D/E)XK nuclease family protein [Oscillospiraceae bacterium]